MIFFSRYIKFLEKQIEELKAEKKQLQTRVEELTNALVPVLRKNTVNDASILEAIKKPKHDISHDNRSAKCICGWVVIEDDPAELQQAIATHNHQSFGAVKMVRKSWPEIKRVLENQKGEE